MLPNVTGEEAYWGIKQKALEQRRLTDLPDYKPIEMPRNSPTGFVVAFFAVVTGFALIWHIWWMVVVGLVGAFATFVVLRLARPCRNTQLSAEELAEIDRERRGARIALVEGREHGITPVEYPAQPEHDPHQLGVPRRARRRPHGPGAEAHRHRLRLLDLPAVRFHHVLGLLCRLCGAVARDRRRPERRKTCST